MLSSTNPLSLVKNYFSGIATIFMLHRVFPFERSKLAPNENMKVSPEFLERFIVELKYNGYNIISLDRLNEIILKKEETNYNVVFTLDDGYLDNYTHAYPIFKKYSVPFTIYITTSFPEKKAILWWYALEDLLIANDEIVLGDNTRYICKTTKDKVQSFMRIRNKILNIEQKEFLYQLNTLFSNYDIDWYNKNNELTLDWEHITEMSKNELCTIAGHTKNHYAFNKLSRTEITAEICRANEEIEAKIFKRIEHFAYPFGTKNEVGKAEFNLVKSFGFKTVTTTRRGTIYHDHVTHLECLPRIMLTEDFDIKTIGNIRLKRVVTV